MGHHHAHVWIEEEGIQIAKLTYALLPAMLLMTLLDSAAIAQQKRPISQETFERMIQIQPLIIEGNIAKVDVKLMTPNELYGRGNKTLRMAVTEVTMNIEKIIAGEYDGNEIQFIVPEGKTDEITGKNANYAIMKFNIGDHALIAFTPDSRGTGYNILDRATRIFRVEGTNLVPYREEFYLAVDNPLELLARKTKEREMPEVVKTSDLICTGTVTQLIDLDSPSRKFILSIDETLKGIEKESEITVEMSEIFLPSTLREPGFQVFLFLKKTDSAYRPVAGINGYYSMDGENLMRGHHTPVRMSAGQLKSNIKMWKEVER